MIDVSIIDSLLEKAEAHRKPEQWPNYKDYYAALSNIKFPFAKQCKEYMGDTDCFSDAYIDKMKTLHDTLIKTESRVGYSFALEGDSKYQIKREDLWKCNIRWSGAFFQAVGILISKLNLGKDVSILEPGCGTGYLTEILAKIGCKVDSVDVSERYCQVVRDRIQYTTHRDDLVAVYHADIESYLNQCEKKYDVILFFESFHHIMNHYRVLEKIVQDHLSPNGKIVLAAEPIYADREVGEYILPYEWGLRFDGDALHAMRRLGWLELGFKESYLKKIGERLGLSIQKMHYPESVYARIYILSKSSNPNFEFVIGKEEMIFKCAQNIINQFSKRNVLADLFISHGYKAICIYGYGRLGKMIYNALEESTVEVAVILDRRATMIAEDVSCPLFANIRLCKEALNACDAIIVTAIADFDDVKADLCKYSNLPIVSLKALLDDAS